MLTYSGARVLVVDDEEMIRLQLHRLLSGMVEKVSLAPDGPNALQQLQSGPVNVVFSDVKMGKMNGIELLEKIRLKFPNTAVIMISGLNNPKLVNQAKDLEAIYFIRKPYNMEEIMQNLKLALQWNIGKMIHDIAAKYLKRRKAENTDYAKRLKLIKVEIKHIFQNSYNLSLLNDYYAKENECSLTRELDDRFSQWSVRR